MLTASTSIDVPDLAAGERFYADTLDFVTVAAPFKGVAVMRSGGVEIALLEKAAGSRPAPGSDDVRRYERHWTPVHIDFHVTDLDDRLARVAAAGGIVEQVHGHPKHGKVAFCSDPFGHGFCLLERPAEQADPS